MKKDKTRHSGYVALLGRTNVGKSTFLNALMQTKVAIVSDKPQTTRKKILGIKTTERGQIIFFDCPGIHKPHFKLNELMMKEVNDALHDADLILYFIDIGDAKQDEFIFSQLRQAGKPVFLVINKIDKLNKAKILEKIQSYRDMFPWKEIVPISALKGDNLELIEDLIFAIPARGRKFLPGRRIHPAVGKFFPRRADPRKSPEFGRRRAPVHDHPENRGDQGPRGSGVRARRDLRGIAFPEKDHHRQERQPDQADRQPGPADAGRRISPRRYFWTCTSRSCPTGAILPRSSAKCSNSKFPPPARAKAVG